jgi:hypothetical protein
MKKVHRLPSAIIISSAVVVISWQLMLRPVVGLANNGDFGKVLGSFGLGAPREHEFRFADTKYDFDSRYFYKNGFFSSEFILVVPALALSAMLSRSGRFDLRHMGLMHGALFLLAIILFVRLLADLRRGAQYGLGLAVLFVFGDVAYVSYLKEQPKHMLGDVGCCLGQPGQHTVRMAIEGVHDRADDLIIGYIERAFSSMNSPGFPHPHEHMLEAGKRVGNLAGVVEDPLNTRARDGYTCLFDGPLNRFGELTAGQDKAVLSNRPLFLAQIVVE